MNRSGQMWRELIERSGTTQKSVAAAIGISQHHLSRIINGNATPSATVIVDFAELMNTNPIWLAEILARDQVDTVLRLRELRASTPPAT